MGSGTSTVSATQGPPSWLTNAYQSAIGNTQNLAKQSYTPYTGQTVAGFTDAQNRGIGTLDNAATMSGIQNYRDAALQQMYGSVANPVPAVQPYWGAAADWMGSAANTNLWDQTQHFSGDQISKFMSPYTQQVVDATQAQFNNSNAQQQNQLQGQAISAGAWGGDRAGVAQGVMAGQQQLAQAPVIAGLYNQGYGQALQEFNTQQAAQEQAAVQQAGLKMQTGQNSLSMAQQLLGAEQGQNWLQSQAATQFGNLGQQAYTDTMQQGQASLNAGTLQQQLAQEQLNVPYQQWMAQQAWPYQTNQYGAGILGQLGSLSGGTSYTTSPGPSTTAQLAGLGTAATGLLGGLFSGGANGGASLASNLWDAGKSAYNTVSGWFGPSAGTAGPVGSGLLSSGLGLPGDTASTVASTAGNWTGGGFTDPGDWSFSARGGGILPRASGGATNDSLISGIALPPIPDQSISLMPSSTTGASRGSGIPSAPKVPEVKNDPQADAKSISNSIGALAQAFSYANGGGILRRATEGRVPGEPDIAQSPAILVPVDVPEGGYANIPAPVIPDPPHGRGQQLPFWRGLNRFQAPAVQPQPDLTPSIIAPAPAATATVPAATVPAAIAPGPLTPANSSSPTIPGRLNVPTPAGSNDPLNAALNTPVPTTAAPDATDGGEALPEPPLPPAGGPPAPAGAAGPSGGPPDASPPTQPATTGIVAQSGVDPATARHDGDAQEAHPDAANTPVGKFINSPWMALVAAGLGMMGSRSHYALQAIGEGGLTGLKTMEDINQRQQQHDIHMATLANTQAYQSGMLGVRGAQVGVNQQKADAATAAQAARQRYLESQSGLVDAKLQQLLAGGPMPPAAKLAEYIKKDHPDWTNDEALAAAQGAQWRLQLQQEKDQAAGDRNQQSIAGRADNVTRTLAAHAAQDAVRNGLSEQNAILVTQGRILNANPSIKPDEAMRMAQEEVLKLGPVQPPQHAPGTQPTATPAPQQSGGIQTGTTALNKATGQRMIFNGTTWTPVQ